MKFKIVLCSLLLTQLVQAETCPKSFTSTALRFERIDQAVRLASIKTSTENGKPNAEAGRKIQLADKRSSLFVRQYLSKCGWPNVSQAGEDVANAISLLVIHATEDPSLQQYALHLMQESVQKNEFDPQSFALLTDKLLVGANKLQRYGTQFDWQFNVLPLENPDKVDELRASFGMLPLKEYIAIAKQLYAGKLDNTPQEKK